MKIYKNYLQLFVMKIEEGDILQRGLNFYRVHLNVPLKGYIIMNKILYNPKTEKLQICHEHEKADFDEIGDNKLYTLFDADNKDTIAKLELIKRKYKLQKLDELSKN